MLTRYGLLAVCTLALVYPAVVRAQDGRATPPSKLPEFRRGLLCLPHVGLNQALASGHSPGLRAGSLLGYHLSSFFSLNAELTIDVLHVNTPDSAGYDASEVFVDFAVSPLVHFGPPQVYLVAGPKLGFFRYHSAAGSKEGYGWGPHQAYDGSGLAFGITLGAFIPRNTVAVGALFSYTGHRGSDLCESNRSTGYTKVCGPSNRADLHVVAVAGALLF